MSLTAIYPARPTTFEIHNNGGRPFQIQLNIEEKRLKIKKSIGWDQQARADIYEFWKEISFVEIFIGQGTYDNTAYIEEEAFAYGNTLLVQLPGTLREGEETLPGRFYYLYIGCLICEFSTTEQITHFVSTVCNSDVPYGYAWDNNRNYYFFQGNHPVVLFSNFPIENIQPPTPTDIYQYFYRHDRNMNGYPSHTLHAPIW